MKAKFILLVILIQGLTVAGYAQTSDAEADALLNLLGVQKKEAIRHLVNVSEKDSASILEIIRRVSKEKFRDRKVQAQII